VTRIQGYYFAKPMLPDKVAELACHLEFGG